MRLGNSALTPVTLIHSHFSKNSYFAMPSVAPLNSVSAIVATNSGINNLFENREADNSSANLSTRLGEIVAQAPAGRVTIEWLFAHLINRSPEILLLAFAPVAIVPATSTLAGALLLVVAIPLAVQRPIQSLPTFLGHQSISSRKVTGGFKCLLAGLKFYESRAVRRSGALAWHHTRLIGTLVTTLSVTLLVPLPFSNILPGLAIGILALASLEQDRKLLLVAILLTALSLSVVLLEAAWLYRLVAGLL